MTNPSPTATMNADIWRAWIDDLRSGAHKQARGVLNDGLGGFCCLGRLCDIAVQRGQGSWLEVAEGEVWFQDPVQAAANETDINGDGEIISGYVQDFAGFGPEPPKPLEFSLEQGPYVHYGDDLLSLASLNDGCTHTGRKALTFAQIADLIETQITPVPTPPSTDD